MENANILEKYQKRERELNNLYLENKVLKEEIKRHENKIRELTKKKLMEAIFNKEDKEDE